VGSTAIDDAALIIVDVRAHRSGPEPARGRSAALRSGQPPGWPFPLQRRVSGAAGSRPTVDGPPDGHPRKASSCSCAGWVPCSSWTGWRSALASTWPRPRLSSLRRNH